VPLAAPTCMTSEEQPGPRIVVLDSGALLSSGSAQLHATSAGFELLARLYRESSAAAPAGESPSIRFVTTAAVLAELRDEKTREMMAALPFQIEVVAVQPDAVRDVHRFAQLTGDAKALSATDIQILALTYQLEKQYNGLNFIKTEPRRGKAMDAVTAAVAHGTAAAATAASRAAIAAANAAAAPQSEDSSAAAAPTTAADSAAAAPESDKPAVEAASEEAPQHEALESDDEEDVKEAAAAQSDSTEAAVSASATAAAPADATPAPAAPAADDDDGEGAWITPSNLHQQRGAGAQARKGPFEAESGVACVTTDYAMQNVLLQMGLRLLSLRGRSIRSLRTWMKKCHACDALSADMGREFCERCGHHSMIRVQVTVNRAGLVRFWHGTRHLNLRGTIYSIPRPKGGRHANNLLLSEDTVDERIKKGNQGWARPSKTGAGEKTPNQMFHDSVEFGIGRTGPNSGQNQFGYGKKNPNAHSGHAQKKKKGKK